MSQKSPLVFTTAASDLSQDKALCEGLLQAENEGSIPISRCKIQIVGDSGEGKTSLRKHLLAQKVGYQK